MNIPEYMKEFAAPAARDEIITEINIQLNHLDSYFKENDKTIRGMKALREIVEIHQPELVPMPCPDGKPGCAVLHYSTSSRCSCGFRSYPCPTMKIAQKWLI